MNTQPIQPIQPIQTEIRNGQEVVIMSKDDFDQRFKKKRVSKKQRVLQENGIDLKHLRQIQYRKKEDTYTFKIFNIPNLDEVKKLVAIQESYPAPAIVNQN